MTEPEKSSSIDWGGKRKLKHGKVQTSVVLSEEEQQLLYEIMEKLGVKQSAAIRTSIHVYHAILKM